MTKFKIIIMGVFLLGYLNASPVGQGPGPAAGNHAQNVHVRFLSGKDMEKILEKYPNAELLEPSLSKLTPTGRPSPRDPMVVQYNLGRRVSGDYLVASDRDTNSFFAPTDVQLNQKYPSQGIGAILSYVSIVVHQSTDKGRAYLVAGGIGQRFIQIVVEATQTYWFDYETSMYGY